MADGSQKPSPERSDKNIGASAAPAYRISLPPSGLSLYYTDMTTVVNELSINYAHSTKFVNFLLIPPSSNNSI